MAKKSPTPINDLGVPTRQHVPARITRWAAARGFALVGLLALVGCGGDSNIGLVSGTVTVDGTPAKIGSISFFPIDEMATTAGAEIIDGQYSARVPVGTVRVVVRVPKKIGEKKLYNTPDSPVQPVMDESLPAKYNDESELRLEVKPGKTVQDYNLATE